MTSVPDLEIDWTRSADLPLEGSTGKESNCIRVLHRQTFPMRTRCLAPNWVMEVERWSEADPEGTGPER